MRDSIIKNTGNSRYLKSAISAATTWEQFRAALIAGTLPIDLNGINSVGWQQVGDALNKANLLPDGIVTAFGLPGSNPQVKDGISRLPWHKIREWTTAGSYTWTAPDLFNGRDYTIGVMVIGGGASGGAYARNGLIEGYIGADGGPSGYSNYAIMKVTPGSTHNIVVGAGGASVTASRSSSGYQFSRGNSGGSSSFNGLLVAKGGTVISDQKSVGGQPSVQHESLFGSSMSTYGNSNLFGGVSAGNANELMDFMDILSCYNPFEQTRILGAGGFGGVQKRIINEATVTTTYIGKGGKHPITGLGAPDGEVFETTTTSITYAASGVPNSPGCGGCGMLVYKKVSANGNIGAKSGAGADGAVMIYVMGVEA